MAGIGLKHVEHTHAHTFAHTYTHKCTYTQIHPHVNMQTHGTHAHVHTFTHSTSQCLPGWSCGSRRGHPFRPRPPWATPPHKALAQHRARSSRCRLLAGELGGRKQQEKELSKNKQIKENNSRGGVFGQTWEWLGLNPPMTSPISIWGCKKTLDLGPDFS